eukprot:765232-Hanusia_phi.AAC.14
MPDKQAAIRLQGYFSSLSPPSDDKEWVSKTISSSPDILLPHHLYQTRATDLRTGGLKTSYFSPQSEVEAILFDRSKRGGQRSGRGCEVGCPAIDLTVTADRESKSRSLAVLDALLSTALLMIVPLLRSSAREGTESGMR